MPNNNYRNIETVPNQRVITIHKEPTNAKNKYTTNNIKALEEAAKNLQSKCGFKLYMYFAKNQNTYHTALSSSDFCKWAKCGMTAYNTAFKELEKKGYLIKKAETSTAYTFYDKAMNQEYTSEIIEETTVKTTERTEKYIPKIEEVTISLECFNNYSKPKEKSKQQNNKPFIF